MKTKLLIVFALCTLNLFSQTNLVPNGGFETWTNSTTLSNWTVENSVTQNTFLPAKGSYSANLSLTSSLIPKISIPVSLVAGTTYIVKYKYKYLNTNFGGTHPITLSIQNGGNTSLTNSSFASNNSWTQKQTTFTADQTIAYDLSISINSFDAEFFGVSIDEVQIYAESDEKYTLIPDPKFEDELIYQLLDSEPRDGRVVTSNISELVSLDVSFLNISNLTGIQDFVGLKTLDCSFNNLTSLNLSKNLLLQELNVKNCKLTSLDLSKNIALKKINCQYNQLTSLNVKNGNNTLLTSQDLFFKFNTNLTCIQVDDVAYSNTNWSTQKEATAEFNTDCTPYTLIPDLNFENKLIALGIDSAPANGKVATNKINTLTDLNVSNSSINDLTGIQDFKALQSIDCQKNNLTSLDVSNNINLIEINCSKNQISSINLLKNKELIDFNCDTNRITTLDFSKNSKLETISCYNNLLTDINIENSALLTELDCGKNKLTTLNVTKNVNLTNLYCHYNQITNIDVSQNAKLVWFMCHFNELTSINVSNNPKLEMFDCLNNKITSLDISKNPLIYELACENNQLTYLNLKNGANTILKLTFSNFVNNPNLKCILVDDVAYSNAKWGTKKDATATYNTDCPTYTLIPDVNFENKLIALGIDSGATDGKVLTSNISSLTSLDLTTSSIADLTGIQDFTGLIALHCGDNQLSTIDITKNILLTYLNCFSNKLTSLNVSKNKNLQFFGCSSNQLSSLDVSENIKLTHLYCNDNQLTSLDVSKHVTLTSLYCSDNNLSSLNLKNGKNTLLSIPNSKNNPNLKCIQVDDATYSNSNWSTVKDATATYSSTCSSLGLDDSVFDKIAIYPNPTKGELHIDNIILTKATVYDALGKLVKTTTFTSGANDNMIHLTGLTKGIYYVYLESEGANTAKKIIVE